MYTHIYIYIYICMCLCLACIMCWTTRLTNCKTNNHGNIMIIYGTSAKTNVCPDPIWKPVI